MQKSAIFLAVVFSIAILFAFALGFGVSTYIHGQRYASALGEHASLHAQVTALTNERDMLWSIAEMRGALFEADEALLKPSLPTR